MFEWSTSLFCILLIVWDYRHKTEYKRCDRKELRCKNWMCKEYDNCGCTGEVK